jgi:Lipase (class 3)
MGTIYTPQMMLLLAYSVAQGDTKPYTHDCSSATTSYKAIEAYLANTVDRCFGTDWKIVWGPAIFSFPINIHGRHIDNTVFVARNGSTNDYVIAIAGTDPVSAADWIFEDFLVATTVPWFLEISYEPRPRISLGTFNGLTILLNIAPPCDLPGNGMKLVKFLHTLTRQGPVNLYTTGHSLGGALAPSLTLALDDLRLLWDLRGDATFYPFAFAGPTPGDANFAAYFNQKFPQGLQRVWNALDIVPHAWDTMHLEELPTIYGQSLPAVADAVKLILRFIEPIGYTPLNGEAATFSGPQQNPSITTLEAYLKEAGWQHVTAYYDWAIAGCPQS